MITIMCTYYYSFDNQITTRMRDNNDRARFRHRYRHREFHSVRQYIIIDTDAFYRVRSGADAVENFVEVLNPYGQNFLFFS